MTPDERPVSTRRLILKRAGIVLLVLLVFVVLPGYLGSRPGFWGRMSKVKAPHDAWASSTHAKASCQECHVKPTVLARNGYMARMVGEFYLSLVNRSRVPGVFVTPTNAACLVCHSELRTLSPKGDLQIPHRAHIEILKMTCVECHKYLVHTKSPEGKHTPPMAECLRCHNGKTAKDDCHACHTEKNAPATHRTSTWLVKHSEDAKNPECVKCHKWATNWCSDCHSQRPQSHGRDWRDVHGTVVKKHRNCEACHAAKFCVRCHGVVPKVNYDPELKIVE